MQSFNPPVTENSKDKWLTPPEIIKALGHFDLDPWDTARTHYDVNADGLKLPWFGRVWLNPPYGDQTFIWMKKLVEHGNGIALILARTDTIGFHAEVWPHADALFFYKGRLRFFHVDGTKAGNDPGALSVLVACGADNVSRLRRFAMTRPSHFVDLKPEVAA